MREITVSNARVSELRDALDAQGLATVEVSEPDVDGIITVSVPDDADGVLVDETLRQVEADRFIAAVQFRTYLARLHQVDTDAPTAAVLKNTMGGEPTFSYVEPGVYRCNLTGAFPQDRTVFPTGTIQFRSAPYTDNVVAELSVGVGGDFVEITTRDAASGTGMDGFLGGYVLEVRVYDAE